MAKLTNIPCETCGATPTTRKRYHVGPRPYLCGKCRDKQDKEKVKMQTAAYRKGRKLAETNGHKCQQCGIDPGPYKLDAHHKTPLLLGGTNDDDNLILLCEDCHKKIHYG